jgi:hypothetical protein
MGSSWLHRFIGNKFRLRRRALQVRFIEVANGETIYGIPCVPTRPASGLLGQGFEEFI